MIPRYEPQKIEGKWQERWAEAHLYKVLEDNSRPKWYELTMFPYTSGDVHIGHWYAMAPSDAHARFKRMQGYNVLHPMGFDAFGLPAENAAIRRNIHPFEWTMKNVQNMRSQLKSMGAMYDWKREVITCLPEYYRWTQWFFLKLYHAGLAYQTEAPANFCPTCQTVLANEQVINGLCERCGSEVIRRRLSQWFFRITRYAEELLDFSKIEWPEKIKIMQENWIGKSEGMEVSFGTDCGEVKVFTTRPDTLFGVTFMVFAPEHPLVPHLTAQDRLREVERYIDDTQKKGEIERAALSRSKSGVFLGSYALNKVSGERIPIFISDYVLLTYGTGVVMGVPAHDQRDFEFALQFSLPIKVVIAPPDYDGEDLPCAYTDPGMMINSGQFDHLPSEVARERMSDFVEKRGGGERKVIYHLRDWLISRQRYWGAPIPIVHCSSCGVVPVPDKELPVLLPPDAEFKPTGDSPLRRCPSFVNTVCPRCGAEAERETDTMDTFMCSSWYFLRYTSSDADSYPFDPQKLAYWMPVDQYTGGAEHAVMHLLYSRFFVKAMRDIGILGFDEPFLRLFNQGTIVVEHAKMSKSRGNVTAPDDYVSKLGADSVRVYLMFIGPWDEGGEWNDQGISGISRWLKRIWNLTLGGRESSPPYDDRRLIQMTHHTIKKATLDIERFHFNTAISALMEFTNYLQGAKGISPERWDEATSTLLLLLAPLAPHISEELWERTGHKYSIHTQAWPKYEEGLTQEDQVTLVVEVNGKVRDRVVVPSSIIEQEAKDLALNREKIKSHIQGRRIDKVIYVPKKLVNIVVS
jgi:leucyl-tRNA synthetase